MNTAQSIRIALQRCDPEDIQGQRTYVCDTWCADNFIHSKVHMQGTKFNNK